MRNLRAGIDPIRPGYCRHRPWLPIDDGHYGRIAVRRRRAAVDSGLATRHSGSKEKIDTIREALRLASQAAGQGGGGCRRGWGPGPDKRGDRGRRRRGGRIERGGGDGGEPARSPPGWPPSGQLRGRPTSGRPRCSGGWPGAGPSTAPNAPRSQKCRNCGPSGFRRAARLRTADQARPFGLTRPRLPVRSMD